MKATILGTHSRISFPKFIQVEDHKSQMFSWGPTSYVTFKMIQFCSHEPTKDFDGP